MPDPPTELAGHDILWWFSRAESRKAALVLARDERDGARAWLESIAERIEDALSTGEVTNNPRHPTTLLFREIVDYTNKGLADPAASTVPDSPSVARDDRQGSRVGSDPERATAANLDTVAAGSRPKPGRETVGDRWRKQIAADVDRAILGPEFVDADADGCCGSCGRTLEPCVACDTGAADRAARERAVEWLRVRELELGIAVAEIKNLRPEVVDLRAQCAEQADELRRMRSDRDRAHRAWIAEREDLLREIRNERDNAKAKIRDAIVVSAHERGLPGLGAELERLRSEGRLDDFDPCSPLWPERWGRDGLKKRRAKYREALEWIAGQFCTRAPEDDATARVCPGSGDCLTEHCLPCYARAVLDDADRSAFARAVLAEPPPERSNET